MPSERTKVKSFKKWREHILMHIRTKVFDCERLEVGVGVDDEEVQTFLFRLLSACIAKKPSSLVCLLIDDFDLPLIVAAQNGFLDDALDFYSFLFPLDLLERAEAELHVQLKIVVMTERHVDVPKSFLCYKDVDATLLACNIEAKSKCCFGFSAKEISDLCTRESLSET